MVGNDPDMAASAATEPFDGRAYARDLTPAPGVYRMYAADDDTPDVLEVKAGGVIGSDAVRHPLEPMHSETVAQLLELAREAEPLALRWGA